VSAVRAVGSTGLRPGGMGSDPFADGVRRRPRPLEQRIGTMQGRLVHAGTRELECSPGARWREEFRAATALRLNHIELVADRLLDSCNPMWSADGRHEIVAVAQFTGVEGANLRLSEVLVSTRGDDPFVTGSEHRDFLLAMQHQKRVAWDASADDD
jgi:hypothetical protein